MKRQDKDAHIGANAVFKRTRLRRSSGAPHGHGPRWLAVEVLYSEVSAFRYIPDLKTGAGEATRGLQ